MAFTLAGFALLLAGQGVVQDLPKFSYLAAYTPGQREIALGPLPQYDVTMEVRFEKTTNAEFTKTKIYGESLTSYSKGYVRWSCIDGKLFDKPCRILKMDGITKGENRTRIKTISYGSRNTTTYWISPEGKLLRQSIQLLDPEGVRNAECIYWADHIEVSVADRKGRRSFTVFPKIDLSLLDLQFKPMLDGEKVILPFKEYYVYNPFEGSFDKYKATVGGSFHGSWMATKFDGTHVDIEGPEGRVVAYISKEGDLIKVDLPKNHALVLDMLPHSRDPFYIKTSGVHIKTGS